MFEYRFRAYLFPRFDVDSSFDYIELQALAPKRFMWNGNVSSSYDFVSMNWSANDGSLDRQKGELQFNLRKNTMTFVGRELQISAPHFFELTKMSDDPANRQILDYLMRFLEDAKSGKLPKPSHHSYEINEIAEGDLQHFASGYSMRYSTAVWPILWAVALIVFYRMKWKTKEKPIDTN